MGFATQLCLAAYVVSVICLVVEQHVAPQMDPYIVTKATLLEKPEERYIDTDTAIDVDDDVVRLEKRSDHLGTFDLSTEIPKDKVMLDIYVDATGKKKEGEDNKYDETKGVTFQIKVACVSCSVSGSVDLSTDGLKIGEVDLKDLFTTTIGDMKDVIDIPLVVSFKDLSVHVELKITFAVGGLFVIPIWGGKFPKFKIPGMKKNLVVDVDLELSLDLIFHASAAVEFQGGFDIKFPNGLNYIIDVVGGEMIESWSGGSLIQDIPFQFTSGSVGYAVLLRATLKAGFDVGVGGKGIGFAMGAFIDPVAYSGQFVFDEKAPCEVELRQKVFGDVGIFAQASLEIGDKKFDAGPSLYVTFYTVHIADECVKTSLKRAVYAELEPTPAPVLSARAGARSTPIQEDVKPTATSAALSTQPPSSTPDPTQAITSTIYTPEAITITSCITTIPGYYCPPEHAIPIVQTFEVIQHVVVYPLGENSTPTTLPDPGRELMVRDFPRTVSLRDPYSFAYLESPIVNRVVPYVTSFEKFEEIRVASAPTSVPAMIHPSITPSAAARASNGTTSLSNSSVPIATPSSTSANSSSGPSPTSTQASGAGSLVASSLMMSFAGLFMGLLI
ncbi:hypothetical protein HYFRA_00002439 [Hymenoscyphus fraxineus]|uniref:Uncharacterized protein n=1 Tax=Hymenoscyphus fraxineus TaxID=746836 RepID=A0A9N9LB67_9HELO|nr:hypothetical protein HYFRA_00002439 [Hymenoscyphus fraxineus]